MYLLVFLFLHPTQRWLPLHWERMPVGHLCRECAVQEADINNFNIMLSSLKKRIELWI